jgi:hypothetical protein
MGLFDKAKLDKAKGLLGKNADKVRDGIDKAADVAGKKFGHKVEQGKIDSYADKAKDAVGKLADEPAGDAPAAADDQSGA